MFLSTLLVFLHGCPDPTTAADLGNPGPGGAAPGSGDGPPPHDAGAGMGPPPAPEQFDVGDQGGVSISGQLQYTGDQKGQVRLDFLRTDGDTPPHLLHVEKLDQIGPFDMRVPANTGPITIVAFVDVDDDGPNSTDPAGMAQVAIEEAAITNLSIELSDSPDLGALTPGNAPPPEAELSGSAPEDPQVVPEEGLPGKAEPPPAKEEEAVLSPSPGEENPTDAAPTETVDSE